MACVCVGMVVLCLKTNCEVFQVLIRVSYRIFCWGGGSNCKGSASVRKHGHTRVSVRAT